MLTTVFHLIRHGENDVLKHSIAGRSQGVHLNEAGKLQARAIASAFRQTQISRIVSSPLDRARETAMPLAEATGRPIELCDALLEVEFAGWTGRTFKELEQNEDWRKWNTFRSASRVPGGESILEVQSRVVGEIERLRREFPGATIALFSHGDPIRSAIVYYLGMPLDMILRLQTIPGSIATLAINDWSPQLRCWNQVPSAP